MKCRLRIFGILFIILTNSAYCQNTKDSIYRIKVYHRMSYLVVPFPTKEIKITNCKICSRNLLPPRYKMKSEQLDAYDSWDKRPKCIKISKEDYDSIVTSILNLRLMETNKEYLHPKIVNGLIMMKTGGCKENYIFETRNHIIELPIENYYDIELPPNIEKFDSLFKRITNKYIQTD